MQQNTEKPCQCCLESEVWVPGCDPGHGERSGRFPRVMACCCLRGATHVLRGVCRHSLKFTLNYTALRCAARGRGLLQRSAAPSPSQARSPGKQKRQMGITRAVNGSSPGVSAWRQPRAPQSWCGWYSYGFHLSSLNVTNACPPLFLGKERTRQLFPSLVNLTRCVKGF